MIHTNHFSRLQESLSASDEDRVLKVWRTPCASGQCLHCTSSLVNGRIIKCDGCEVRSHADCAIDWETASVLAAQGDRMRTKYYCPGCQSIECSLAVGAAGSSVDIFGKHFARLRAGWLFDEIVNAYFFLLQVRCRRLQRESMVFFNSFFFTKV